MMLSVPLRELEEFIFSIPNVNVYVKELHLNAIDDKHLDIEPRISLHAMFVDVPIHLKLNMHILDVNRDTIQLEITTQSSIGDMLASKGLNFFKDKIQETGYVELRGGTKALIHLDKIEQLKPVLDNFTPNDLLFEGECAVLDFCYTPKSQESI